MSTVSVIIPCYNRASLVGETIENMLTQSLKPYEVIVVDDGSTDDSAAVIESFGAAVRLVRQSNQGPGTARNAGLKIATGEFIQFMDSDDLASNNKLEVQVKALESGDADFAYGPWIRCHIGNKQIAFTDQVLQALPVPFSRPMLEWFISGWSLVFQNCLFRRSLLDKAGVYRTDLMPSEDSEYFIRIALGAAVQQHIKQCQSQNLPSLPTDHPYYKLISSGRKPLFLLHDFLNRFNRRFKGTPDYHKAFGRKPVTAAERSLVTGIGYQPVNTL
jgi:glycosyltransferase involved in cell wall biosynthesis